MRNNVYASQLTIIIAACISFAVLIGSPTPAAAFWPGFPFSGDSNDTNSSAMTARVMDRLCERQGALGNRLVRPLIDPNICNPPAAPTVTLTADPMTIEEGEDSTLEWSSTNATSCEASDGWSGAKNLSGNEEVMPEATTTYTIECTGDGGTTSDSVTVTVNPAPEAPTLTLMKTVTNDDGGVAIADDFQARIDGVDVDWGVAVEVSVGTHSASETTLTGYTAGSWGGDCAADGSITLAAGEDKTCTIVNDDQPGTLHVVKVVINDNDGEAEAADFSFQVNDGDIVAFEVDGQNDLGVDAGMYTVTEVAMEGYTTSYDNCTNVAIASGGEATCTITNNDVAPATAMLTLMKTVTNDDGGNATADSFQAEIDGVDVPWGVAQEVLVGAHTASETTLAGYAAGDWGGDCAADGTITLAADESKTCTITNNDEPGTLHIVKVVVNDNDGTAQADDFSFQIDDGTPVVFEADGQNDVTVDAGTYTITEPAAEGYTTTYDGCESVVVVNGGEATCTITNNDEAPQMIGHVVISEVVYDALAPEADNEWIELYNGTDSAVDLEGWDIGDTNATSTITGVVIEAGGFAVIAATSTLVVPDGVPLFVVDEIGNMLANGGDGVILYDASSTAIDQVAWGDEDVVTPVVTPPTADGESIARDQLTEDTDTAADWEVLVTPTPGA